MARWQPTTEIGKRERIGRRLFDEPLLEGGEPQKPFAGLDLRNFEEKRDDQTSLDRMGRSGIEKPVFRYLLPRATLAGSKFKPPKSFDGWAVIAVQHLVNPPPSASSYSTTVTASPIPGKELEENIYHAHVTTPHGVDHYSMALHLRHLFQRYGFIEQVTDKTQQISNYEKLTRWMLRKWVYISDKLK